MRVSQGRVGRLQVHQVKGGHVPTRFVPIDQGKAPVRTAQHVSSTEVTVNDGLFLPCQTGPGRATGSNQIRRHSRQVHVTAL